MTTVENIADFFELELNTIDGAIGMDGAPIRAIYEEPPSLIAGMRGSDPQITMRRSEVPAGTAIGDLVTFGLRQFKIRDRVGAGKDLVRFRLQAGPDRNGSFYRITAANLDLDEGWPDDITHYLTCVEDAYIMLPSSLDVSVLITAGALELVPTPSSVPNAPKLYFYKAGVNVYDDEGEFRYARDLDFAHDFDTEDAGYYMTAPVGSLIGLPDWRSVGAMVSSGLLIPVDW